MPWFPCCCRQKCYCLQSIELFFLTVGWVEIENGVVDTYTVPLGGYDLELQVNLPEKFCGPLDNPDNTLHVIWTLDNGSPALTRVEVVTDNVLDLSEVIDPYTPGTEIDREGELSHSPIDLVGLYNVTRSSFGVTVSIFAVRWTYTECVFTIEYPSTYSTSETLPGGSNNWRIEQESAVSILCTVTDGLSPFTFSVHSGDLPPGCLLNTTTGEIYTVTPVSGSPTTGSVVIKCVDDTTARAFSETYNWEFV